MYWTQLKMVSEQGRIEDYTDWKYDRIGEELLDELSDDSLERKKKKLFAELNAAEKRIKEKIKQKQHEIHERKQQVKLFVQEEENDDEEI